MSILVCFLRQDQYHHANLAIINNNEAFRKK